MSVTYWFEEQRDCNARPAFVGLGKFTGSQMQGESYFKDTVYLDNGEPATSDGMQRSDLAFDTAKTNARNSMDVAFTLNTLFANAGKNFLTDAVWNSSDPVILRNATLFGGSPADVAVTRKGASDTGVVPCTLFTISPKGSPTSIDACVARVEGSNLVYVVYFQPEDLAFQDMMPTWGLTAKTNSTAGITRTLQCLEPIYCPFIQMPSGDERTACEADGQHLMKEFRDEHDCTVSYSCIEAALATFAVNVIDPSKHPVSNLEVDVWSGEGQPNGPPAMSNNTDAQGRVSFRVTQGTVWVGFNMNNFPKQYSYPGPSSYRVEGSESQATVNLQNA
jgi:hypothetical protein